MGVGVGMGTGRIIGVEKGRRTWNAIAEHASQRMLTGMPLPTDSSSDSAAMLMADMPPPCGVNSALRGARPPAPAPLPPAAGCSAASFCLLPAILRMEGSLTPCRCHAEARERHDGAQVRGQAQGVRAATHFQGCERVGREVPIRQASQICHSHGSHVIAGQDLLVCAQR
jgi:hypothetical protein